jgi:hypothetical protein
MEAVISVVMLLLGIIAIIFGVMARKKAALIMNTPTSKIGDIKTAGFYEIKGRIDCENPISLPNWDIDCVWYNFKVEEKEQYTDREGKRRTRWRTLDNRTESRTFKVTDRSGTISVIPRGADLDGTTKDYSNVEAPGFLTSFLGGRQTLGQKVTANYIETGSAVYVLGQVTGSQNNLSFVSGGEAFIISTRSEEEVLSGEETTYSLAIGGGLIALVASFMAFLMAMR